MRSETCETSTMLVLSVMGVCACSRSVSCVHSGCAKRVRFSYSAKSRSRRCGVEPSVCALLTLVASAAFS